MSYSKVVWWLIYRRPCIDCVHWADFQLDLAQETFTNETFSLFCFTAVCVAGYSSSKNEILELRLPPKLFASENKVLKHQNSPLKTQVLNVTLSLCYSCVCVLCSGSLRRTGFQSCPRWFHRRACSLPQTRPRNPVSVSTVQSFTRLPSQMLWFKELLSLDKCLNLWNAVFIWVFL